MTLGRRVFLTGGTGFIGSHFVELLRARGYQVTALVRRKSEARLPPEVRVVSGELGEVASYRGVLPDHDIVCHLAADYRIGPVDRRAMYATNVEGTRTLLDAAWQAGVRRILYISSTAALGETFGAEKDESHRHNGHFRTYYEETKHIAHGLALERVAAGAPITIAIPGGVFGPRDHSVLAQTIRAFALGKIPFQVETQSRFNLCHVRPLCDGLLRLVEHEGEPSTWVLAGKNLSMPELFTALARHYAVKVPKGMPTTRLAAAAYVLDKVASVAGMAMPLSREALAVMDGSTYTYRSDKARRELGWDAGTFAADFESYLCCPEMIAS